MRSVYKSAILMASLVACAAFAKGKGSNGSETRVMIFDPTKPKDPPTVAYDPAQIAKGFEPAVLFTNVKVKADSQSGDGETLEVEEQKVTTDAPAEKSKKKKASRRKSDK